MFASLGVAWMAWTLSMVGLGCVPKVIVVEKLVDAPAGPAVVSVEFCPVKQPGVAELEDYRMMNTATFLSAINAYRQEVDATLPIVEATGCDSADVLSLQKYALVTAGKEGAPVLPEDFLSPTHGTWRIAQHAAASTGHLPTSSTKVAVASWSTAVGLDQLAGVVTGVGSRVVVIDAGTEQRHPMLGGLPAAACFATGSCGSALPAKDSCVPGDGTPNCGTCQTAAECAHGTGMAGIIGGSGPNYPADQVEAAMRSLAPDAIVLPVRVLANHQHTSPSVTESDLLAALKWVRLQSKSGATVDYHIVYLGMASSAEDAAVLCNTALPKPPVALGACRA